MYVGLAGTASFFKSKHEFRILPKNPYSFDAALCARIFAVVTVYR